MTTLNEILIFLTRMSTIIEKQSAKPHEPNQLVFIRDTYLAQLGLVFFFFPKNDDAVISNRK